MISVRCGADRLIGDDGLLRQLRSSNVAVLANPTSVTRDFGHLIDHLMRCGVRPVRLFGPEHGVRGEAQDMIAVADAADPLTGIPTVSLYGHTAASLTPPQSALEGIDVVLIDIQDVGSRYYTYVYTAMLLAEACTKAGVSVLVLDRPNPIGGAIEGAVVQPGIESFVGMLPLPNRHGLTMAEVLAFAVDCGRTIEFETIAVEGWRRNVHFDGHDAPWVMPSPNMPTLDTALVYPGMCLLEGTNMSEGRGTTRPFEVFGAPWLDGEALRSELMTLGFDGVALRPLSFEPTFQKWARQRCGGLQIHVTDRDAFQPVRLGAAVIWATRRLHPTSFDWRHEAYEFVEATPAIDLLFGSDAPRHLIDAGAEFGEVEAALALAPESLARVERCRLNDYGA